ncbi:MAG: patatin-like phospholipase family protein [Sulfurimonas sp.]|nr:patatin-like phospholipase family protein [Sulfurimonas sp.]
MNTVKQKISLVLGSGGARGYAHIGVIEELEKTYEIVSISGSSMGAFVGALYACGKLQEFKEWILTLDAIAVMKLVDLSLTGKGIISGDKVFLVIEKMIGDIKIEDLPISYTAVATDIIKQKEVWLQKGSLLDAVRASVAIPTLFTPKELHGRYLVDGGVLNPLPIAPTVSDITDLTIAVSLNAIASKKYTIELPKQADDTSSKIRSLFFKIAQKTEKALEPEPQKKMKSLGMFDIMGRTIDIMQNAVLDCKMAGYSPDLLIGIPNDACGFYEFHRAYEMIELGKVITQSVISDNQN